MHWRSIAPVRHPHGFVEPCLPTNASTVPTGSEWTYEIEHDGFRFVGAVGLTACGSSVGVAMIGRTECPHHGRARRASRHGGSPSTARAWCVGRTGLPTSNGFVLPWGARARAVLDGQDLRREPWEARRDALVSLLRKDTHHAKLHEGIQLSEHLDGANGEIVFRHACKLGLEGIVAKRRDRPYRSGRSPDWIKVKNPDAPAATRIIEG